MSHASIFASIPGEKNKKKVILQCSSFLEIINPPGAIAQKTIQSSVALHTHSKKNGREGAKAKEGAKEKQHGKGDRK